VARAGGPPPSEDRAELDVLQSGWAEPDRPGESSDDQPADLHVTAPRLSRSPASRAAMILVAVAAVAGTGALSRQSLPDDPKSSDRPANGGAGVAIVEPKVLAVRFVDRDRGYGLGAVCPQKEGGECRYTFRVTTDGGRGWYSLPVPLPPAIAPTDSPFVLSTVGALGIRVSGRGERWFSADGGRTWTRPPTGLAAVDAAPRDAMIEPGCRLACGPFRVTDPRTGARLPLAHQPGLAALNGPDQPPRPSDGSHWVTGQVSDGGPPAIAVSRDQGRNWRLAQLPAPATRLQSLAVVTRDGRNAYAVVRAEGRSGTNVESRLDAIYTSRDGGASWRRVEPAAPNAQQPSTALGVALLPTGRLLLTTEEFGEPNVWRSDDGGRTFARLAARGSPQLSWLDETDGRLVARGMFSGYYTSTDGAHWTPITLT
jgi:photosystem II stability/assembly factor-like uncharacterized protein